TALAGLGLVAALVLARPELAALAAPFAGVLVAGLSLAEAPRVDARFRLDRERQLEGETVEAELELRSESPAGRLELLLDLPAGVRSGRPGPARELAGDRAARRAVGERVASGAELRRGDLPRHLRGGQAGRREHPRPGRRGRRRARRALPAREGPRRSRRLRR